MTFNALEQIADPFTFHQGCLDPF